MLSAAAHFKYKIPKLILCTDVHASILDVLIILCLNILYYTLCNVWYNMCNIQNNQRVILLISLTCWRPRVTRQQR